MAGFCCNLVHDAYAASRSWQPLFGLFQPFFTYPPHILASQMPPKPTGPSPTPPSPLPSLRRPLPPPPPATPSNLQVTLRARDFLSPTISLRIRQLVSRVQEPSRGLCRKHRHCPGKHAGPISPPGRGGTHLLPRGRTLVRCLTFEATGAHLPCPSCTFPRACALPTPTSWSQAFLAIPHDGPHMPKPDGSLPGLSSTDFPLPII